MENTNKTALENMEMHRKNAEELAMKYNGLDRQTAQQSDIDKILKDLEAAVKGYNDNSWVKMKQDVESTEDPMRTAVKMFSYPIIKAVDKNIGEAEAPVIIKEITDGMKIIDLKKLHGRIAGGIGHNPRWYNLVEKLNLLLTIRLTTDIKAMDAGDAKRISKTIIDTFDIPVESKDIELTPDVISNTKMIKALQMIIDAMLGEDAFKVTSHDVKFVEWRYGKKSRNRLCITCSTTGELLESLTHVCNKLVTGGTYEAEYRKSK